MLIPVKHKKGYLYAQVDEEDFERLSRFAWYERNGYAFRFNGDDGSTEYMHRDIMQPEGKLRVDHIDHDGLNNRRSNLRCVTHAQNAAHHKRDGGRGSSSYLGVAKHRVTKKKGQSFVVNCGTKYIGIFYDESEGARAYDEHARAMYGECAKLNFPTQRQVSDGGGVSAVW